MKKTNLAVVGHIGPAARGDRLSGPHALAALAALGQPTRLEIFRLLVRKEPDGLPAGVIAEKIGCPHNTLSTHLSILARSGMFIMHGDDWVPDREAVFKSHYKRIEQGPVTTATEATPRRC